MEPRNRADPREMISLKISDIISHCYTIPVKDKKIPPWPFTIAWRCIRDMEIKLHAF
jgi:hypothetical protein